MVHPELVAMTILDTMILCCVDVAFLLSHAAAERECDVSWWAFGGYFVESDSNKNNESELAVSKWYKYPRTEWAKCNGVGT